LYQGTSRIARFRTQHRPVSISHEELLFISDAGEYFLRQTEPRTFDDFTPSSLFEKSPLSDNSFSSRPFPDRNFDHVKPQLDFEG
jgi:hypothetical protein